MKDGAKVIEDNPSFCTDMLQFHSGHSIGKLLYISVCLCKNGQDFLDIQYIPTI